MNSICEDTKQICNHAQCDEDCEQQKRDKSQILAGVQNALPHLVIRYIKIKDMLAVCNIQTVNTGSDAAPDKKCNYCEHD